MPQCREAKDKGERPNDQWPMTRSKWPMTRSKWPNDAKQMTQWRAANDPMTRSKGERTKEKGERPNDQWAMTNDAQQMTQCREANAWKQESPAVSCEASYKIWHRPTLPRITAVPSALAGLTSLFGMGRGGHRRYRHLNVFELKA